MNKTLVIVAAIVLVYTTEPGLFSKEMNGSAGNAQEVQTPHVMSPYRADPQFESLLKRLRDAAVAKDARYKDCRAILAKQNGMQHLKERTADMINYAVLFKGVSPSTEAGKAILNEKSPAKSFAAASCLKQQIDDAAELSVVAQVTELAMGLGNSDRQAGERQAAHASKMLNKLAGFHAAAECASAISSLPAGGARLSIANVSVQDLEEQVQTGLKMATPCDPVIVEIEKEVHRYNKHRKGALTTQRVTRTALSAASLVPNIVGPASQVVLFGEIAGTGGTEQDKLLKELYMDKRFNDRIAALQELMHLAIFNYHLGILSGNQLLCACSQQLLTRMVGQAQMIHLLSPVNPSDIAGNSSRS